MIYIHVPKSYQVDALFTAAYLINRMRSRVMKFKTHVDVLSPSLSSLFDVPPQVFGCVFFIHLPSSSRGKLDPTGLKCIFLGYLPTQNLNWPLQQFDVKNAFHHEDLEEEIYKEIIPRIQDSLVMAKCAN